MQIPEQLENEIDRRIARYPVSKRSAVLPVLHALQEHYGFVSGECMEWAAAKLELSPIQVLELVTFYPGFLQKAPGKYHIRVCRTLSCAMAGSAELMEALCQKVGIDRSVVTHQDPVAVSADGKYSIEFAECLASCDSGPVCLVNDDFHESVSPEAAAELLAKYES